MHAMAIPASVKAIGRAGAGTNNIPVAAMSQARRAGVQRAGRQRQRGQGAGAGRAAAGARATWSRRCATSTRLDPARADLEARVEDGKKQFAGVELPQRTLGIIGLGAIGSLVADTAIKLGMKVIGFDPEITVDAAWRLPVERAPARNSIEEVLKHSDFVTLHVPLLPVTRNLIDAKRLAAAKPGAVLLNFARDAIVDEDAVVAALRCAAAQGLPLRFPERDAARASRRSSRCRIWARRRRRPRKTARSWSSTRCASTSRTARSRNAVNFPNVEMPRESPLPRGHRQRERPEHARPDLLDDGARPDSTSTTW